MDVNTARMRKATKMAFANRTSSVEDIDEDSRELLEAEKGFDSEPEVVFCTKMFTAEQGMNQDSTF